MNPLRFLLFLNPLRLVVRAVIHDQVDPQTNVPRMLVHVLQSTVFANIATTNTFNQDVVLSPNEELGFLSYHTNPLTISSSINFCSILTMMH